MSTATGTSGGAADGLLGWWLHELHDLFTGAPGGPKSWGILATPTPDGLVCHVRQRRGIVAIELPAGAAALRRAGATSEPVVLRLAPHEVVRKTVQLPRGERRDIEAIIRNQIEFLAPWPAEKVLFDFEVQPGGSAEDRLVPVLVTMTGRDAVEAAQRRLAAVGLKATIVDSGEAIEPAPRINLLRSAERASRGVSTRVKVAFGTLLLAALGVAAFGGQQLYQTWTDLQGIEARLVAVRGPADEANRLAREAAETKLRGERLAGRKLAEPPAMLVIEALSRAIPDDTHLSAIELRGRELRITGKSPNAADLIALLEGSKAFAKVRFAAPTTREAGQDIDTFSIAAEVAKVMEAIP